MAGAGAETGLSCSGPAWAQVSRERGQLTGSRITPVLVLSVHSCEPSPLGTWLGSLQKLIGAVAEHQLASPSSRLTPGPHLLV